LNVARREDDRSLLNVSSLDIVLGTLLDRPHRRIRDRRDRAGGLLGIQESVEVGWSR
jgi:hypothetical protein